MIRNLKIKLDWILNYKNNIEGTIKMLPNIKFNSDNYDVDSRIKYLKDNDIKVKYKVM